MEFHLKILLGNKYKTIFFSVFVKGTEGDVNI